MSHRVLTSVMAALALAVIALAGCGQTGSGPARGGPLEGRWELTRYAAHGTMTAPSSGVSIDAEFTGGRVGGSGGVNSYSGPYTATTGGDLQVGPLASTQMAGPPEAMAAEAAYLGALERAAGYLADDRSLTIYSENGDVLLVYAPGDRAIVGSWEVTGVNNGRQAVVSVAPGSTITAAFGADGTLSGDGGVNRYSAEYETTAASGDAAAISISPPVTTRKGGPPDLMEQEQRYLTALASARTFTIQGRLLTLRDGDDAIAVTLTRP